ncbi:MAG: glycosyltransferase, partial [Desulfobacula sp.]
MQGYVMGNSDVGRSPVRVSVILPTYNRAWILKDAVDSVLSQDYPHIELIVIDDGSTDNTKEILAP